MNDDERARAQELAPQVLPRSIGSLVRRRIISLRIAAGDSERLNRELDALVAEVLELAP